MSHPNQTIATAAAMALPYSVTLDVSDGVAPTYDAWWSYTPTEDTVVSVYAYAPAASTYDPEITAWLGPVGAPTQYFASYAGPNGRPWQLPVSAGVTYYFRVRQTNAGVAPAVDLVFEARVQPLYAVAAGSLLINDDTPDLPAAFVSVTDGGLLRFDLTMPAGEAGDALADGTILLHDFDAGNCKLFQVVGGVVQAPVTVALNAEVIRANRTDGLFYVTIQTNPAGLRTVDGDGNIGGTTWTLAQNATWGGAADGAGTVFYYSAPSAGSPIYAHDLGTDLPLADFNAGEAGYYIRDILVIGTDVLAAFVQPVSGTIEVRRFNSAGVLQATYGPYDSDLPSGTQPRISYNGTSTTDFWIWTHGEGADAGLSTFRRIQIAGGSVLATVGPVVQFETGIYNRPATATPEAYFGHSFSCPLVVTTVALTGTTYPPGGGGGAGYDTRTDPIRRLRRAPHLSNEQLTTFHGFFQLDLETGLGLGSGQGADPMVMLRWSDDGGHTWSHEHWVNAGRQGQYTRRAIWRRLGRSRDRVYEVVMSDPIPWRLLAAYLDVETGTS